MSGATAAMMPAPAPQGVRPGLLLGDSYLGLKRSRGPAKIPVEGIRQKAKEHADIDTFQVVNQSGGTTKTIRQLLKKALDTGPVRRFKIIMISLAGNDIVSNQWKPSLTFPPGLAEELQSLVFDVFSVTDEALFFIGGSGTLWRPNTWSSDDKTRYNTHAKRCCPSRRPKAPCSTDKAWRPAGT